MLEFSIFDKSFKFLPAGNKKKFGRREAGAKEKNWKTTHIFGDTPPVKGGVEFIF